jgi:predicted CopG family antitoxin
MTNLTLSVPDELYEEMKKHPEIRWSEVARQALAKKLDDLRRLDALLSGSKLTGEDVDDIAKSVNERVWKKHRKRRATGSR